MSFYLQSSDGKKIPLIIDKNRSQNQFTIGRIPTNSLQLVDPTVSKNHAYILYYKYQNVHVLSDLGSVNGTFVNEQRITQNQKRKLKHDDKIQFGKHQITYYYKNSNPQPPKKGKINFKDYHFELEDSQDEANLNAIIPQRKDKSNSPLILSQNKQIEKQESKLKNNNTNKMPKQSSLNSNFSGKNKFQRPSGRIKIPNLEEFLQFQQQQNAESVKNLPITSSNHLRQQNFAQQQTTGLVPSKWQKSTTQNYPNNQKVKLPVLPNQLTAQQKELIKLNQRKKQIQQAQFNAQRQNEQNQRRILQEKLKIQIQKSKNQQKLLSQKILLQRQLAEQHEKIQQQKLRIEQQLKRKIEQGEEQQKKSQLQQTRKQQELFQQLQKDKQRQILQLQEKKGQEIKKIQQKQIEERLLAQKRLKEELDRKKLQLELEAQALTKQYQTIYKETIKKMKRDIQRQEEKIKDIQIQLEKFYNTQNVLKNSIQEKQIKNKQLKQAFLTINSRNKAFLLYASHLQNKIDQLIKAQTQEKYSLSTSFAGKTRSIQTNQQIQESISASRKLINMKIRERNFMQAEIRQLVCQISVLSIDNQHFLDTILENHQQIQTFKQVYYQCMEQQKTIQKKWDLQIEQISDLDNKCKNAKKEIQNNRKKINEDLLDNIKKLTQQRVHMLKMMHYAEQDKKNAAKFLIQEMLNLQQQIRNIKIDSENTHSNITQIILSSEEKKRQNSKLSELLFGNMDNGSSSHHFDNMKNQINRLMDLIQQEKQIYSIQTFLKASEEIKMLENKIYQEIIRQKNIKQAIKKDGSIPARSLERNPLIFFGEVLQKKQLQFQFIQSQQKQLQKNVLELRAKTQALQTKRETLGKFLEKHKIKQLEKARKLLL